MTLPPSFSVIIPTYHRNDLLAKCLDCLAPGLQTLASDHYEVIVTDDGSQTTAEAMIQEKYPWVKWVAGPCKGPAANRNNGAKYAQGEWLVFTDDDCLPDPQWLEAYQEAIAHHQDYSVFEGRVYVDRPQQSLAEKSPTNETGGYLWSCNLAIQFKVFTDLQGFNERFPYAAMEDVELRLRLKQSRYSYLFVKTASVCHPWKPGMTWRQLKQHQQSTLIYLSIHPSEATKINSIYYLRFAAYGFIKNTISNLFTFNFKGLAPALLEHLSFVQMALILAIHPKPPLIYNAMKSIVPQPNWPESWKLSYGYDRLEIYGDRTVPGYAYAYQNRRQHTLKLVQMFVPSGGHILDVAAAQGNFSLSLAELGYKVTWNDLREELIEYVKLKQQHGSLHFQPGNVFELNLHTQFDAVLMTEVIEHVAHPDEFLKHLASLVKPNGCVIMSTPNGEYFQNRLPKFSDCPNPEQFENIQFQPNSDGHIFLLHLDEIRALAQQAGLTIIASQFCTNTLTNGYLKLGQLLKMLPSSLVAQIENLTTALPPTLCKRLHTCMVVVLAKSAEPTCD